MNYKKGNKIMISKKVANVLELCKKEGVILNKQRTEALISKIKIEKTGGYNKSDCIFSHGIITEESYQQLIEIDKANENKNLLYDFEVEKKEKIFFKALSLSLNFDFLSILKEGKVEAKHITKKDNLASIAATGFAVEDSYILDLGKGIYAYLETDDGVDNIKDYIEDFEEERMTIINCLYEGLYMHCVYGKGHTDYIVMMNNRGIIIDDHEEVYVDDFLFQY